MKIIRQTPILGGLSSEALTNLVRDAAVMRHEQGYLLFSQGDPADAFYVVLGGWIKVYRLSSSGAEAVVGIFTRGQSFAEAAAFTGGVYPASGEAVTDVRILKISARRLFERITASPEIGLAMLASTSQHLHLLVRQIEALKAHTGAQRIAEFLLELAPDESGACVVELPYDKALIAARLGMKPESLSRAFHKLKNHGVDIRQRHADIRSLRELREFTEKERADVMREGGGD
ncbi:MAG: Crp/Fnr family transcriptional regulator [Phyllobacteriaceae bacterium]|nr:Crp/Fnr family transcriptional regulator [Phyllobacteriaceae bacterium]